MHESSLVRTLLERVEEIHLRQPGSRVRAIYLRVGEFSGVEGALLQFAFEDQVAGTSLQDARLEIEQVSLMARCGHCGTEFIMQSFVFECPQCLRRDVKIVQGEELVLDRVELEEVE